jgi:hypothetical protein
MEAEAGGAGPGGGVGIPRARGGGGPQAQSLAPGRAGYGTHVTPPCPRWIRGAVERAPPVTTPLAHGQPAMGRDGWGATR